MILIGVVFGVASVILFRSNDKVEVFYNGGSFFCFIEQHSSLFFVPARFVGDSKVEIKPTSDSVVILIGDGRRITYVKSYSDFIELDIKTGCFSLNNEFKDD